MPKITPVILSGGSGTRLWPVSRSSKPKQFLSLTHDDTMLQLTAMRTSDPDLFDQPVVVANAAHAQEIREQLASAGVDDPTIILEPLARNTAPAIALAAIALDPDAVMLVMPSDHVIADVSAFHRAIAAAAPLVEEGWLVTFGITPTAPETGYGYVRIGDAIDGADGVHLVERFVEKPDRATAEGYLAEGCYAWNSGIFMFRSDAYVRALGRHVPEMLACARAAVGSSKVDALGIHPNAAAFADSPSDSIDYAVMEKDDRVAVVPVSMGWSDVGSWDALHEIAQLDDDGNHHKGEIVSIGSSGCLIHTHGPLVAAVGVSDLIVVATGDAILIMPRGSSQDVKLAVEALKASGHESLHRTFAA